MRGAFERVQESTVGCGCQPCPLGLGLSRGHEQRPVPSYCPSLAFKGTRAATARHPPALPHRAKTLRPAPPGTGSGSREACVAVFTLLDHFPNFLGVRRDLCLYLTPGLPFSPQFGDVKIQGLQARPGLRLCLFVDQSHSPREPWHCVRGTQNLEGQQGWGAGPVGLGAREQRRVLLACSLHIPERSAVPEGRLRAGALGVPM